MKLVVSVAAAVVMVVGTVSMKGPSCNPNPDCTDHVLGDKVTDPRNCTNYYVCTGPGVVADHPAACEDGEKFEEPDCVPDGGTDCEPSCPGGGGGSGTCKLICNNDLDFVSDPADCSKYLICVPGGTQPLSCPPERPYFDGTECGSDETMCCVPGCEPSCEVTPSLVPDPLDCQRYYFCDAVGTPSEEHHYTCQDGYFDIHAGECSKDAPCTLLCPDSSTPTSGGGGGNSTTPSSGCVDALTCTEPGLFAACNDCQPEYFDCSAAGQQGALRRCTEGKVFNTNQDYPFCVNKDNCPYPPSIVFTYLTY